VLVRLRDATVRRLDHRSYFRVPRLPAHAERHGEVSWAHADDVEPFDREYLVQVVDAGRVFDESPYPELAVRELEVLRRRPRQAEIVRATRASGASLTLGPETDRRHSSLRVRRVAEVRHDDAHRARLEKPEDRTGRAFRYAHERRDADEMAGLDQARDGLGRDGVVLGVDEDPVVAHQTEEADEVGRRERQQRPVRDLAACDLLFDLVHDHSGSPSRR
jgi:hypothetical protein